MPRYIRLDENNVVVSVRVGDEIVPGETQSDEGDCGQILQTDGTFVTPEPPVITPMPTLEEIKENQLILMDAIATLFETITTPV